MVRYKYLSNNALFHFYFRLHASKTRQGVSLNPLISNASYFKYTPCGLNPIKHEGGGISPKLAAVEMWALLRYLPLILGDFVPQDEYWEFLIQLETLTDYVFGTKITESMLVHFSYLFHEHMLLFKKLFPLLSIKPKQHFLVYFQSMVQANGPLALTSCLKYELRNNSSKRWARIVCNFKNIAYICCAIQPSKRGMFARLLRSHTQAKFLFTFDAAVVRYHSKSVKRSS